MKPKCLIPWTNINIGTLGRIDPCCKFDPSSYQEKLNIMENNVEEYLQSKMLDKVKANMLQDKWPKGCERCKVEEENNIPSKRQMDYERWKQHFDNYDQSQGFITASVAFGNTCNLKCITCEAAVSSRWRKESKDLFGKDVKPLETLNEQNVKNLYEHMKNVVHLDIPGGEPFLSDIEKQKDLLQGYIDSGKSKDISIHYTTNAQLFPDSVWWDLWSNFKEIDMQLSIDGIAEKYQYIRHPASWETLEKHVERYLEYEQKIPNLRLSVSHTVSAYNIFYLPDFFEWCEQMRLPKPWCGKVHNPPHMRPTVFPEEVKGKIIAKLLNCDIEEIHTWADLLEQENDEDKFETFCRMRDRHDQYRKLDFSKTFAEFSDILKAYETNDKEK